MEKRRLVGRLNRSAGTSLVVMIGLAGFVVGVYLLVVLGIGALIGRTDSPSLVLSVLATAVVALFFAPVQTALERIASRGAPATNAPYDVLSRFSEAVTGGYTSDDLPARMSMLLAQGTGAQWAQVWLTVSDQLTLAATWPAERQTRSAHHQTRSPEHWTPVVRAAGHSRCCTAVKRWECYDCRSVPGCASPLSRNGCSAGWPPKPVSCCGWSDCAPSWKAVAGSRGACRVSSRRPGSGSSRPRTSNDADWSGTSTTELSNTSWPCRSTSGSRRR